MSAPMPQKSAFAGRGVFGSGGKRARRRVGGLAGAVDRTVRALSAVSEQLEPRRLFTTLVGGDVFEYTSPDPANPGTLVTNRIVLRGNIVAELIGGSIAPGSNPFDPTVIISDVPGRFYQSDIRPAGTDFLGGLSGGSGVRVTGNTSILSDPSFPGFNPQGIVPYVAGGSASNNIAALATLPTGVTYGVHVVRVGNTPLGTPGEQAIVQVLRFNADGSTAGIVAQIGGAMAGAPNSNFVNIDGMEAVTAAAYDPFQNRIYFVARGRDRGNPLAGIPDANRPLTQQLFSVQVTDTNGVALSSAQIANSVAATPGAFQRTSTNDTNVTALAFDVNQNAGNSRLVGFIVSGAGTGGLFDVNLSDTTNINNFVPMNNGVLGQGNFNSVRGLAFVNDNRQGADRFVYAVEGGAATAGGTAPVLANTPVGPQILLLDRATGTGQQLGSLPGRATGGGALAGVGNNLQDLSYDATRRNPFTGQLGTLVSFDATTDQFVVVDTRNRLSNTSGFALVVSRADADSSIVVGRVANLPTDPQQINTPRPMLPFTEGPGTLRVVNAANGQAINLTGPTGVGGVFLGLKTSGFTNADLNNIPVTAGVLANSLGVATAGNVASGVVASPSLLRALTNQGTLADRLLGQNVTDVQGMAVTANGTIYAVDADGIDASGTVITNDQLVTVDRTGRATGAVSVFRNVNGVNTAVSNNRGMTIDDSERILAVFLQRFADTGGGTSSGGTIPGNYPDFTLAGQTAVNLSITGAGPTGFILAESATQKFLYSFTNTAGSLAFTALGPIVDADGNSVAAARSLGFDGNRLYTVGFSRGNPVPSQSTGGTTVDLSTIDARSLTYAADGNIYLLSVSGAGIEVRQVQRDLTSGVLTGLGAVQTIQVGGTSPVQSVNDLTADPAGGSTLLGIGSSSVSLLPTRNVGALTASDGTGDFLYRGLTRLSRTDVFAVTFNGSTLSLRRSQLSGTDALATSPNTFNVVPSEPRQTPDNIPGRDIRVDINPSAGRGATTALLGVTATAKRPGDDVGLWAIGYSADTLVPTDQVLGNLGPVDVQQMAMLGFSPQWSTPDGTYTVPTLGGVQYGFVRYASAVRDTATSGLLAGGPQSVSIQVVGQNWNGNQPLPVAAIPGGTPGVEQFLSNLGVVANGIVDVRAMTVPRLGAGQYLVSGFNYDSPVPAAPIGGNLGGFFGVDATTGEPNLRGLAFNDPVPSGQLQDAYSVLFNGTGHDIYRLTRSAVTGGITGFSKVSTDAVGIRDPRNNLPILFVYSIFKDPTVAGRFFFVGSSDPTATSAPMTLYALDVTGDGAGGVTVAVNNTDQPPRDLTGGGGASGRVFKAGAINAAGEIFIVRHNANGASPAASTNGQIPSSSLLRVDRATGQMQNFGFLAVASFGSGVPTAGGSWSAENSSIRGMQFRVDTDGNEKLLVIDQPFTGGPSLAELDFANIKSQPQVLPGGVATTISAMPTNPQPGAVAIPSSLPGMVNDNLLSFAVDQYGRGFSIQPGTSLANPDRIWTSPNEVYLQERPTTQADGDNYTAENVRVGWLTNEDGTAFTESFTTWTGDFAGQRLVGVVRNDLVSSNLPGNSNFGLDRLYSLDLPGSVSLPTVASNGGGNSGQRIVTAPVRRVGQPNDTGLITINSDGTTPGTTSNITGLGFDLEGSLVGLNKSGPGGGSLVGLPLNPLANDTALYTGNPTFNTFTLTDQTLSPFTTTQSGQSADPRGLATDIFGRFYTADGGNINEAAATGSTIPTRLLVSANTVSLFRIDSTTGVAERYVDLADDSQLQQQPILSRFGGIAFQPSSPDTVFLVQKDLRSGNVGTVNGQVVGIDRLVTFTAPAAPVAGAVPYTRYNNANTAGAIQVGNTVPGPGTSNGVATNLTAIDFSSTGQLIGLDTGAGASNRLVRIELDIAASPLAPTNSVYATDAGAAGGLAGLTAFGTQFASVQTGTSPDTLRFSNNDLSLFAVDPATGNASVRAVIARNGVNLSDDQPVVALATDPSGSGNIYAVFRGTAAGTNTPADFLYQINAATGAATLIGQVRLTANENGNPISGGAVTRLTAIEFSGERDASGAFVLLGLHDPSTGTGDRQLVTIPLTGTTVGTDTFVDARVVPGSAAGEIPDTYFGLVSDVVDTDTTRLPSIDRGRFFTLDTSVLNAARLNITPTQLYSYNAPLTLPTGTSGAQFLTVGKVQAPPNTLSATGSAVLETVRSIDFNPVTNQLFAITESVGGTSTLYSFPASLPAPQPISASPVVAPDLVLNFGGPVTVVSASSTPLPGQTTAPTFTSGPTAARVQSIFFLADGTLRAAARVGAESGNRLIDIPTGSPGLSVARTDPGVPDAAFSGFSEFNGLVYAIDNTTAGQPRIAVPNATGGFTQPGSTGGGTSTNVPSSALGQPTLGTIDPATGLFTPVTTSDPNAPGRLPVSITDVKAFAYDRVFNTGRTSQGLYIVDQDDRLIQISPVDGSILRTVGFIRDSVTGLALNVGSLAFDRNGQLVVQDAVNGRALDVSTVNGIAGANRRSVNGSLAPTVGAIAFDASGNRFLAADNATGINTTASGLGLASSQVLSFGTDLFAINQDVGKVYIGGTVAGNVNISGSVGEFYAGWLVTGTLGGLTLGAANPRPGNFSVGGNLGSLITAAPIGGGGAAADIGDTAFRTGTDIVVQGRIGTVRALGGTQSTFRALNNRPFSSVSGNNQENETRQLSGIDGDGPGFKFQGTLPGGAFGVGGAERTVSGGTGLAGPQLALTNVFNDNFGTAQRLYVGTNADGTSSGVAVVDGVLENVTGVLDGADYYAVPLLAGQTIDIQLTANAFGVFDPDGRLVFSSHSRASGPLSFGTYRFKADRPGEYRIAVATSNDTNFNGSIDGAYEAGPASLGNFPYTLTVSGLGDLAVSAIAVTGTLMDATPQGATETPGSVAFSTVYAQSGDIGGISAGAVLGFESSAANTLRAGGSIRSLTAGQIGELRNGAFTRGASYSAGGDVGLIRSSTGVMVLNFASTPSASNLSGTVARFNPDFTRVGGNIQMIDAADTFVGNLFTDRALGVLRAGDMATTVASFINVNADNLGQDGTIDYIDVDGDIGTASAGGPVIYTNSGGNIRYMAAGGTVFRDRRFGGGTTNEIFLSPGQPLNFVDDSGATIRVEFDERTLTRNPAFDSSDPTSQEFLNAPTIAYLPYPVRSGGSVLMILEVSGLGSSAVLPSGDAQIRISSTAPAGRGAEITALTLGGTDNAVTVTNDANGNTIFTQAGTSTLSPSYRVKITGGRLDIADFTIADASVTATGDVTAVINETGGELLNFTANSIGTLSWNGDLGFARPSVTGTAVLPRFRGAAGGVAGAYPFLQQPYLINIGTAIDVRASGAIGNLVVGDADTITADSGGNDNPSSFEGIAAPVIVTGSVNTINAGEGVAHDGSGDAGAGVVIVGNRLESFNSRGDVRGLIVANGSVGEIRIGGALIDGLVGVLLAGGVGTANPFFEYAPINNSATLNITLSDTVAGTIRNPGYEAELIRISDGAIGSDIYVNDIETLSVGGFGLLRGFVAGGGGGYIDRISVAGYGIRGTSISGYTSLGSISLSGNGSNLSTQSVTPSVRRSEFETINAFSGHPTDVYNDIHAYLTTSAATPIIDGVTATGVLEDSTINGNGRLGSLSAYEIRSTAAGVTNTEIAFANSIGTITTRSVINGLNLTTGRIDKFLPASDVLALNMTVSGRINSLRINGSLASNSTIASVGPNAGIQSLSVKGNFDGSLSSAGRVRNITIGGNLTSGSIVAAPAPGRRDGGVALDKLTVGGSLLGSQLTLNGNVGTINVANSTGAAGDTITVNGNLNTLNAGTNRRASGKSLLSALNVSGTIGTLNVNGRLAAPVTAGGTIKSVKVASDGASDANIVAAPITSTAGDITSVAVTGGNLGGNVSAFNKLRTVSVRGGNINAGVSLSTTAGDVGTVSVRQGNLFGSVRSGTQASLKPIGSIQVDGQVGDGTNPVSIRSSGIKTFRTGSVFSGTTVDVAGTIGSLAINGDLRAGSVIKATAISSQKITGAVDGEIILT